MSKIDQNTILAVEDDVALNDAYRAILSSAGYRVETSFNGQEALDILDDKKVVPSVILLDLRMPVLDGVGFFARVQAKTASETTVVVFSNYDAHADIDEAYELGVERYVLARAAPKDLLHLIVWNTCRKAALSRAVFITQDYGNCLRRDIAQVFVCSQSTWSPYNQRRPLFRVLRFFAVLSRV